MNIAYGTVVLRAIEEEDLAFCLEMINSPAIEVSTVGKNFPVSRERQLQWFRTEGDGSSLRLMIHIPGAGPVGMVSLTGIDWISRHAEVGIKLSPNRERPPRTTDDTAHALLRYAFQELNLNCLYAHVLEDNLLSRRLLLRYGMKEEGRLRQRVYKNGTYHDLLVYSLLKQEYEAGCGEPSAPEKRK